MAETIEQLSVDFGNFQTDFNTFATNVTTALAKVSAGGVTPAQQTILDSVGTGLQSMDATVKGITFPA
jgi:hypothetical protein